MNVVIIPAWYPSTADPIAGIFVQQQAKALLNLGLKISVFFVEERRLPHLNGLNKSQFQLENEVPIYRMNTFVPPKRIRGLRFWWLSKWERLLQDYKQRHHTYPELLHAHSFVGGAVARYLGKKYAIPYVITEHYSGFISGNIPRHWQEDLKGIYQDAAALIAVSPKLADALRPYRQDIRIISNMIDTHLFCPPPVRPPDRPQTIITVGSLIARKNQAFLIKVFGDLPNRAALRLMIVGEGPDLASLKQLTISLNIEDLVSFTGQLSPELLADKMRNAHLYVSTSKAESFALAPIEALACGLPVVSTRCGSILEKMDHEAICVLDHEHQLGKAILNQLEHAKTINQNALNAFIQKQYSPDQIGQKLIQLYQAL